ncbi:Ribose-phosphate pyrophosphokinase [Limosilactobacillus gastricus DSM 16045]|uniref:Ribose-phosphate pyrophosphokinase n=2 Tax=Limosilactobacillus gastricus TaxID=227942 RepID=A0A0R1VEK9_9LACO|nr:Ribose-phosphate pyrophosphokinase [Limosilactobacillus gastricus DSM 16045]
MSQILEDTMTNRYFDTKLKIFALSSNRPLAEKVAENVGLDLGQLSVNRFSDGEIQINIEESVRGDNVYIIQSTSAPVNDNLMELLILVDALRRASARTINVVIPYYGYARQDRKARSREPITAKLVANMLQNSGVSRVLALDLHAAQIQGFFDIPVDHLMGAPLLADYFIQKGIAEEAVVVSPDHGGVTRARALAEFLKSPIAIIDKRRPKANVAQIMNIIGDVKGKKCIMLDDMIDTAGTITLGAQALMDAGAKEVYVSCTHAVLSGPAIERLENSPIKQVVVTDSIKLPKEKQIDKIVQVSVAPLIASAIKRINENRAVSPLFHNRFTETSQD